MLSKRTGAVVLVSLTLVVIIAAILAPRIAGAAGLSRVCGSARMALGQVLSGHTIKHLAAAAAGLWILRMLQTRRPVELPEHA